VAFVAVIGQVGDDEAAHLQRIDRALVSVNHFASRTDQHGIWYGGVPIGIKRREQRIDVRGAEDEIASGSVEFGQGGKRRVFFVGIVDADGDDLERARPPW
jgi:hypothetical protein